MATFWTASEHREILTQIVTQLIELETVLSASEDESERRSLQQAIVELKQIIAAHGC
jgi:hypothetical protein